MNISLIIRITVLAVVFVLYVAVSVLLMKEKTGIKKAAAKTILKGLCLIGVVAAAIIVVFNAVLMLNQIPSSSMETTVMAGDLVISTRLDSKDIERYDIMVFRTPDDPDTYYIKRVIGLPGETITVENGHVYADGVLLNDNFVNEEMDGSGDGIYEVPEGCYFMMGDNRNHSYDSRFWNGEDRYIPLEDFVAKAKVVVYPLNHFGSLGKEE